MSRKVNPKLEKEPVDIIGDTLYYRLRLGRDTVKVTKRMGEHVSARIEELNIQKDTGFLTDKQYRQEIKEIKSGLYKDIGRANILFENIVERTGIINVLLEGKVNITSTGAKSMKGIQGQLSPEQYEELQRLGRNINIIARDRGNATKFYKDISRAFKDLSKTYQQYLGRGGHLTKEEIDDLIDTAKLINRMAEKYVR